VEVKEAQKCHSDKKRGMKSGAMVSKSGKIKIKNLIYRQKKLL
jgi:hypothetical protein